MYRIALEKDGETVHNISYSYDNLNRLSTVSENGAAKKSYMSDFSIKISGVNSGKNSWSSVYKAGTTKLKNKTASKMSSKVVAKGIGSNVVDGFTQDIYFGSSNAINNLIPKTPNNVSIGYKNPMFVVSYTLY